MIRVATEEDRPRATVQWIREHTEPKRKYKPSPGRGVRRKLLLRAPKSIASRYYQLLSGHTAIGPYLKDKIHKAANDKGTVKGQ